MPCPTIPANIMTNRNDGCNLPACWPAGITAQDICAQLHRHPSLRGALAAKQSRLSPRKDSGLLRCARNDEFVEAVAHRLQNARAGPISPLTNSFANI